MLDCRDRFQVFAAAFIAACPPLACGGSPVFTVTELGTLGGAQSAALGLNDLNQVVGWSHAENAEMHGFLWVRGTMTDLGTLGGEASRAWAINNAGVIVGESLPAGGANFQAFTCEKQQMTGLPTLGGSWSAAYDINETGVIAGLSYNALEREQAVTWSGGAITNIAQAGGAPDQRTRAYGLNDAGAVVGWGYTPLAGPSNAFRYSDGQWLQIGGFGQFQNSEAYDIGSSGIVVGSSAPPAGGDWHAAIWLPSDPTSAVILGTLPGFPLAELNDINGTDHAVGRAYVDDTLSRALYYDGETLHDLNDFLPDGFQGDLVDARDINENGAIAATARHNGLLRALLLSPPVPGDLDQDGIVDINDLLILLGAWGLCGSCSACPADLDGDCVVGVVDLLTLLGNWT